MKLALAVLCIGAVSVLLRVLVALVKEWVGSQPRTRKFYLVKSSPSRQRGELIVMNPVVQKREFPTGTGERMAI